MQQSDILHNSNHTVVHSKNSHFGSQTKLIQEMYFQPKFHHIPRADGSIQPWVAYLMQQKKLWTALSAPYQPAPPSQLPPPQHASTQVFTITPLVSFVLKDFLTGLDGDLRLDDAVTAVAGF